MSTWVWLAAVAAVTVVVAVLLLRLPRRRRAGYALALGVTGDDAPALWRLGPGALRKQIEADTERLAGALQRLDGALRACEEKRELLSASSVAGLTAAERRAVREMWWLFFDAMMAVDTVKEKYDAWFGVDYLRHPELHAQTFSLAFAALCAQVRAGHGLLAIVGGSEISQTLFDETMHDFGLPAGTFTFVRDRLARTRDLSFVPLGAGWYDEWMAAHLRKPAGKRLAAIVKSERTRAEAEMSAAPVGRIVANKIDVLKAEAFVRWFPLQRRVAEWAGHTRVVPEDRRLVSDAQIEAADALLQPGDIVIARRNWYLSNVGLPGFWPHAALYVGTPEKLEAAFRDDAEAAAIVARWKVERAPVWEALGKPADDGCARAVLEAVGAGVSFASLRHAAGADYVAALRPRLSKAAIARAIDTAMSYFGRPYDFNFDFATDDAVVCSELVMKAYEPAPPSPGLRVPFVTIAGRETIPPNEMIRVFDEERGQPARQLDFVLFLDGREAENAAVFADEETLAASWRRPKWDLVQP